MGPIFLYITIVCMHDVWCNVCYNITSFQLPVCCKCVKTYHQCGPVVRIQCICIIESKSRRQLSTYMKLCTTDRFTNALLRLWYVVHV
jgi:hypothetical protein